MQKLRMEHGAGLKWRQKTDILIRFTEWMSMHILQIFRMPDKAVKRRDCRNGKRTVYCV